MSANTALFTLLGIGALLWLANNYIPMGRRTSNVLNVLVPVGAAVWVLYGTGMLGYLR